jgi:hypothetical protein
VVSFNYNTIGALEERDKGVVSLEQLEHNKSVRYHDDGYKELNACVRFFLHMVYL